MALPLAMMICGPSIPRKRGHRPPCMVRRLDAPVTRAEALFMEICDGQMARYVDQEMGELTA
ncbi:hypothetical protein [Bosea sp. 685]|uniref:hypothetical protein n=1 Tax=Bosea sp. 685 TaxID=3080057 RepID=UPI002892A529|nr:hypothetical protein [Bosea sp. 685]WNJ93135.1 hypothetical protein RMR04_12940 [Bosea sp. 685]